MMTKMLCEQSGKLKVTVRPLTQLVQDLMDKVRVGRALHHQLFSQRLVA